MYRLIAILLLLVTIISCDDDNIDYTVGDDFINSETSVSILDTFSVRLSTFMLDSLETSDTGIGLVGNCDDEDLGLIKTQCYFQLGVGDETEADDDDDLDSLTLKIDYSGYIYGDTTKVRTINVYRLTEELDFPNDYDDDVFYNTNSFEHESTPIGSITFRPRPFKDEYLEIRLDDDYGERILEMLKDAGNDTTSSTTLFTKFLYGLCLESETEDGSILGLTLTDTTCYMDLYASRFEEMEDIETEFTFPFTNSSVQFNHIESDRSASHASLITNNPRKDVVSSQTGNESFIQAGLGMYTRIEFPTIEKLLEMSDKRILLKAELILKPVYQSYLDYDLPETLYLYESDAINTVDAAVYNSNGDAVTSTVVIDDEYYKDTYYKFDITEFISEELSDGAFDVDHALLVQMSTLEESVDRVIFADNSHAKFKPILKFYYVFYN